ncbi:MAG: UDP-N-acetylmuramate dehydrogenase [Candidatus Omnitrophica bacterium]|nr:UDP-N-acetylmuramate dehydrogenase [Candidatus Omnitrophota bacterium]
MKNKFPKVRGKVRFNEPLARHTTFHVGGPCKVWVEPSSEDELREILRFARSNKRKILVLGMGSNILFRDKGFDGIAIHLGNKHFKKVRFDGTRVTAGAGAELGVLVNAACRKGLGGIEGLVGIPATLGGAIFMNSGYRGNISDCLEKLKLMDKAGGKTRIIRQKDIRFGYRQSNLSRYIILEATLRLKKNKRKMLLKRKRDLLKTKKWEQPFGHFSAGCIFRNPNNKSSAAQYIDMLGLKGKRMGGAEISKQHANFIINLKNAKAEDILRLISFVKTRVKSRFNVNLVPEIIII